MDDASSYSFDNVHDSTYMQINIQSQSAETKIGLLSLEYYLLLNSVGNFYRNQKQSTKKYLMLLRFGHLQAICLHNFHFLGTGFCLLI